MLTTNLKAKLLGCIDLLMLFPRGVNAFEGKKRTAIRAFLIATVALWPLGPISLLMVPAIGFESLDYWGQFRNCLAHDIITLVLSLSLTWQVAGVLEKRDRFWLGIEVGAWFGAFTNIAIGVPLLLIEYYKAVPVESMQHVYTILACYNFFVKGVITYAVYRINVPLIIGWTMAGFFIDRETWSLLLLIQGMPPLK